MAVVGMANETNRLANGYQVEIDEMFRRRQPSLLCSLRPGLYRPRVTLSASRRQRRQARARASHPGEPREHFLVERDAVGPAMHDLLGFRQSGIEDALLAPAPAARSAAS